MALAVILADAHDGDRGGRGLLGQHFYFLNSLGTFNFQQVAIPELMPVNHRSLESMKQIA